MNCDEAEALLGAYALDALPPAEADEVRAHLRACAPHATASAELRALTEQLPALAGVSAAPAGLRARVLDAVAREPQAGAPAFRSIERKQAARTGAGDSASIRPRARFASYGWAAAAAVFVLAAGLLVWNLVLLTGGGNDDAQRFASRASLQAIPSTAGAAAATVVRFANEDKAVVLFDRPPLDPSKVYQVWRLNEKGRADSLGLAHGDASGHVAAIIAYDASRSAPIAVTVEPASGSDQPTTEPIFRS